MSYVIQQPRSLTNPSDKYRVVDYDKWNTHRQGETTYLSVEGEFSSYGEAQALADRLNSPES